VSIDSYGKAQALAKMGLSIGVVVSLSVLFQYTKKLYHMIGLDPQYSWGIMSALMAVFAMICLFIVDEPPEGIK
jgi:hypothetical protein